MVLVVKRSKEGKAQRTEFRGQSKEATGPRAEQEVEEQGDAVELKEVMMINTWMQP
jgi:hypothetical protein